MTAHLAMTWRSRFEAWLALLLDCSGRNEQHCRTEVNREGLLDFRAHEACFCGALRSPAMVSRRARPWADRPIRQTLDHNPQATGDSRLRHRSRSSFVRVRDPGDVG